MTTIDPRAPEGGRPVSEMQRRIAEEIMNAEGTRDGFPSNRLDDLTPEGQGHYLMLALAAMKAMREPTRIMIDAAYAAHDAYEDAPPPKAWCGLSSAFRAAIDAEISADRR
jgi:hypothetical protein